MALTIDVTKVSVKKQMEGLLNITFHLKCEDDIGTPPVTTEVINEDFPVRYRTGDSIPAKEAKLQERMQTSIDEYKANKAILNHAQVDTVVSNLNSNLVG